MSFFLELKFEEGLACILLIIFHEMELFNLTKIFKYVSDILLKKPKKLIKDIQKHNLFLTSVHDLGREHMNSV